MNRNLKPINDDFIIKCQNDERKELKISTMLCICMGMLLVIFIMVSSWQSTKIALLRQDFDRLVEQINYNDTIELGD